ncbi:universal stress protein [Tahibacter harae]|uniref:Universal stress protein n=1 Tax=Tahibacter harae TaxID=2963937 RepID=A0ABT1QWH3_9GAMM|nr:universal stress protein [Tahibacter harae]MCQ4166625.1 universal stress protein [Tahibacter harae]
MKVLLAVDGSEHSNRAVDYVALHWLPADTALGIVLCHADPEPQPLAPPEVEDAADLAGYHAGNTAIALRYGRAVFASVGLSPLECCVIGAPAAGILRSAVENGADVIVLGAHGSAPRRHRRLGAVVQEVLAESDIPVLVVP